MSDCPLKAALYLEAVLPALPLLAAYDPPLAAALAGPDVSVALSTAGGLCARLAIQNGQATVTALPRAGDLRLWFPSAGQLVRAFDGSGRTAIALPLGGWRQLTRARRLIRAAERLETLLNTRAPGHLRLHIWGNLIVGVAAAAAWLRHHPASVSGRTRFNTGIGVLTCPDFPESIWFDAAALTWGLGEPASPVTVRIAFANLSVVLAELDNQLDQPAALGLGDLHITGLQPLAEHLGLVMLKAGKLLKPATTH